MARSLKIPEKPFGIDFIDPLFAVAVSIGFVEGVMTEEWFKTWVWPKSQDLFEFGVYGLGFLTLLLSWLGYHGSVKARPMKSTWHGYSRFLLDVVLVIAYAVILVQYRNFFAVLTLLTGVYLTFAIWDLIKIAEYRDQYRMKPLWKRYGRELVSLAAFVWFLLLFTVLKGLKPGALLLLTYAGTVGYRILKRAGGRLPEPPEPAAA